MTMNMMTTDPSPRCDSDHKPHRTPDPPDEIPPPPDDQSSFRSFHPYGQPKSTRAINEAIKSELLKAYSAASAGFIYGFVHPSSVLIRLGTGPLRKVGLVKIGRSANVERRMKQWAAQCRYAPSLVFAHAMAQQHQRIERVVHHQLHNARLREHLGCSGCGVRHVEWFRVDAAHAEALVRMWQGFVRLEPYDEVGHLLPTWLARLGQVDLGDPDCWVLFAQGSSSPPSVGLTSSSVRDSEDSSDGCLAPEAGGSSSDGHTSEDG
ncbi:DUF1766-domain-containing protein [Cryphonectria parasitica EP155]|uniref:DUF1766-domain-containing protein n=1 Tax=Cryphonectria parasitica (strain ATCC 38755 / EP155) TaxID=660469 RepID=A0A9P4XT77_CRYP1|nr:DUF1766-domain-containing protein [Cryphonectria parasitica EP155]KAF3760807.1 DUF1766-domain-containing protein [Cryphonectria parasitica EP155]